jgi:hypothetical protein
MTRKSEAFQHRKSRSGSGFSAPIKPVFGRIGTFPMRTPWYQLDQPAALLCSPQALATEGIASDLSRIRQRSVSRSHRHERVAGTPADRAFLPQDPARHEIIDIAPGRVLRAFAERGPFRGGQLALKAVEQMIQHLPLTLIENLSDRDDARLMSAPAPY